MTDWKALMDTRPSGATTAALVAAYGNPAGAGAVLTPGRSVFTASPSWEAANLVKLELSEFSGWPRYADHSVNVTRITVHRLVAPALRATWAELTRRKLVKHLRSYDGWYNPRRVGHDPKAALSVHAFAAAGDFDAQWNGYGLPLAQMDINREVVRCFEECGWTWGGRWNDPWEDGMHFQWTLPLPGTRVPEWQDALGRGAFPVIPPPAAVPVILTPDGHGGWVNVAGQRLILPSGTIVNAENPLRIWVR